MKFSTDELRQIVEARCFPLVDDTAETIDRLTAELADAVAEIKQLQDGHSNWAVLCEAQGKRIDCLETQLAAGEANRLAERKMKSRRTSLRNYLEAVFGLDRASANIWAGGIIGDVEGRVLKRVNVCKDDLQSKEETMHC